ncbi:MAG: hypothetical protein IKE04_05505 [Oscillospiraceae bacterium]|nr:hypothetical protein [Oscillospiraceae bacterium]
MLKVDTTRGEFKALVAQGQMDEILSDICVVVRKLWDVIRANNRDAGEAFRILFEETAKAGVIFDGVEDEDDDADENRTVTMETENIIKFEEGLK